MARPLSLALIALTLLGLSDIAASSVGPTRIELSVSPHLDHVRGTIRTRLVNPTDEPLDRIYLWLPFNRLAEPPEGMDQRNAHWIYPRAFRPGSLEVSRLAVGGREIPAESWTYPDHESPGLGPGQRILALVRLPRPIAPGGQATVEATFRTIVPPRFGRLGRARGVLTLAGGFYPQVADLSPSGWNLSGPMADQDWAVELDLPPRYEAVANGRRFRAPPGGSIVGGSLPRAPYLALVVTRELHRSAVEVEGVTVAYLSTRERYQRPRQERGFRHPLAPADAGDATNWDYEGRALETARTTILVLEELGLAPPPGAVVPLIEVPLRLEMASPVPGAALISDRVYRITPLEQLHRLHDRQVARAVAWVALQDEARREPLEDRGWVLDFLAQAVADAHADSARGGRGPGLREMLRIGAFIPEIDQLLYAPLIEFRHLFLRPFQDEDPVRDEPWRLATSWPRGAVLHDKLVDLLGEDAAERVLRRYAGGDRPLREVISRVAEEDMAWFFDQWLGPYPEVNYRLADVESQELPEGGYRHRITIERQGDQIREPVEVRVVERGGEAHRLEWDGRGPRGVVTVETETPLERVELDPRRRLVEDLRIAGDNPRLDNVHPVQWRPPVLYGLLLYLSATEGDLYALIDFGLRRQYDARNAFRLRVEYDPRGINADLFYQRGLGRLLDPDSASWVLSVGLAGLRTLGGFAGSPVDATAFGAVLGVTHDTRWYRYDPMEGWGLRLAVSGYGSVTDEGDWGWSVGTSARVAGHWTPRVGHTFTGFAGGGIVLGEPLVEQLQSISDRMMLRAFEADETLGRARIYLGVEYRWTVIHDLDVNLLHLARLRALFLALFAAGGTVSRREDLGGMFTAGRIFTEVGAGLRALLEIGGFLPYIIAVDLAYPITPRERLRCNADRTTCVPRNPVGVYVSIQHTM